MPLSGSVILYGVGDLALLLAAGYGVLALLATLVGLRSRKPRNKSRLPAVTVMKPLCGAEPGLYDMLRSFCMQDYPVYQVVFGLHDADDPALAVAERLRDEFHDLDIAIVVNNRMIGNNGKISNLANMATAARHDYWVIADSDIWVGPHYLAHVVPPLADPRVGVVTCLYRARVSRGFSSRMNGLFIDDWFAPSVLLARLIGNSHFCSGATIGIRRATLEAGGGLAALANCLADDYMLGAMTRRLGLKTVLSDYQVETQVSEPGFRSWLAHEVRWMRTIRSLQPIGYRLSVVTCVGPLALLGVVLAWGQPLAIALFVVAIAARALLRITQNRRGGHGLAHNLWLVPLREFVTLYAWTTGLWNGRVHWRGREYEVDDDGALSKAQPRE